MSFTASGFGDPLPCWQSFLGGGKDHAQVMSLILYFQLHERFQDGVWRLLQDLFEHGSVLGLQVDGGPAEYTIRVRLGLCGNIVLEFLFSGSGQPARGPATGGDRGQGGAAIALICFSK